MMRILRFHFRNRNPVLTAIVIFCLPEEVAWVWCRGWGSHPWPWVWWRGSAPSGRCAHSPGAGPVHNQVRNIEEETDIREGKREIFSSKGDLKKSFWKNIHFGRVGVWFGVNQMISHFSEVFYMSILLFILFFKSSWTAATTFAFSCCLFLLLWFEIS